ncbi:MAG: hypothetical protein R2695_05405 [Acidimicrobiales bacterium]
MTAADPADGEDRGADEADPAAGVSLRAGGNLDQLIPVLLFLVLYNTIGIEVAVGAATAWSIKAAIGRRRRGLAIGWWLPVVTVYLILRSVVTILVEREVVDFGISSEAVYFGIGFATKIMIGLGLAVTVVVGRPFLATVIPKVIPLPRGLTAEPRFVRTMATATWFIVVFEIATAIWDIWLFNNSGVNLFLVTRIGVNFILGFVAITAGLMYIDRRLEPLDSYPGLVELLEPGTSRPS